MDSSLERHLLALQFLLLGLLVVSFARYAAGLPATGIGAVDALAFAGAAVGVLGMLGAHWAGDDTDDSAASDHSDDAATGEADGAAEEQSERSERLIPSTEHEPATTHETERVERTEYEPGPSADEDSD
ncbi:hypothetical protein [Haloarchaeobius sp. DFWS5]|uniref:hypothetical protein n=1 Tax=Haloarchaeobius sp. DFWS5 TaxID=3446114 RepID=UPI003EBA161D